MQSQNTEKDDFNSGDFASLQNAGTDAQNQQKSQLYLKSAYKNFG